jgi:hypothetical protein
MGLESRDYAEEFFVNGNLALLVELGRRAIYGHDWRVSHIFMIEARDEA